MPAAIAGGRVGSCKASTAETLPAADELVESGRLDGADVCIGSEPAVWSVASEWLAFRLYRTTRL
jgi:hypothetical protein